MKAKAAASDTERPDRLCGKELPVGRRRGQRIVMPGRHACSSRPLLASFGRLASWSNARVRPAPKHISEALLPSTVIDEWHPQLRFCPQLLPIASAHRRILLSAEVSTPGGLDPALSTCSSGVPLQGRGRFARVHRPLDSFTQPPETAQSLPPLLTGASTSFTEARGAFSPARVSGRREALARPVN